MAPLNKSIYRKSKNLPTPSIPSRNAGAALATFQRFCQRSVFTL